MERLGTGIGWRPEIADTVAELPGLDWVEVVAENICPGHLPAPLLRLRERGTTVIPHGVSLGLGGADRPDPERLAALAERAEALGAPLVTEHIAFVRAGGPLTASPRLEAGHLLPVPRTRDALDVLCENVRIAQDALPVPLALENIAALIAWPAEEMSEGQFLAELVERTGVRLLIDVANLHTNHVNRGEDPAKALEELPVEAIAYVHVAGGIEKDGVWHDSHAHPVTQPVLDVLAELRARTDPPGVLLERDEDFPAAEELAAELAAIRAVMEATPKSRPGGRAVTTRPTNGAATGITESRPPGAGAWQGASSADASGATPPTTATSGGLRPTPATEPAAIHTDAAQPASGTTTGNAGNPPLPSAADRVTPQHTSSAGVSGTTPPTTATRGNLRPTPVPEPADGHTDASGIMADGGESPSRTAAQSADLGTRRAAEAGRERVGLAQASLLSALVAGTPAPEGFDRQRLRVQSRALAAKRADVVAKVAPELPEILGPAYRPAFLGYAHMRPMTDGYRRDALHFAEHLLATATGRPDSLSPASPAGHASPAGSRSPVADPAVRRRLHAWWLERSGPAPLPANRFARLLRSALRGRGRRAA
ncbi:multinuclear nonheme iron-dependent oxidase [Streptomyces sp. 8N616]|uniref:multinuclear nonheme iron-dependent oxidase n=1 Tax=Streptomyces sp. 8N616 TaxID=3457414 RepID=UPI003FD38B96